MELRILGQVELWRGTDQAPLGRVKERSLLGILALSSGRPVAVRVLIDALWDDNPPGNARKDIQIYVSRLRRHLRDAGASAEVITRGDTYIFYPREDFVDYVRFKNILKEGRGAHQAKRLDEAADILYQGVDLWQGPPISELTTLWMERRREDLDNYDRSVVYHALCEVELERKNYPEVLQLLDDITEGHELDSTYVAQRLSALNGCGHYAEFDAYWQRIYRTNVESFGTAPPRELQEFHSRLLQERDIFLPGVRLTVPDRPAQLPSLTGDFVGRRDELTRLEAMLARSQIAGRVAPLIVAITGAAGVGKTELALQWAHAIKRQFPDGQLYADLFGYHRLAPADPATIIAEFLKALGTSPAALPETLAARGALLRTMLDDKRVLIFLDNARDSDQVRPLLPASATCVLVVTSRHWLTDLVTRNGANRVAIHPFTTADSTTLLRRLLSATEALLAKETMDTFLALTGGIPQAIRTIAELAPLDESPQIADLLNVGENDSQTIRATLSWSYHSLPAAAASLFRLLSLHPGQDFSLPVASALAGTTEQQARRDLAALTSISLVERSGTRFHVHPLVHALASELLETVDTEECRVAASKRMLAWYLETVTAAAATLTSHDNIEWINAERLNLVAAVELAARQGWPEAWRLLRSLRPYIERESPPSDWIQVHTAVLAATRGSGDREGEGATLVGLGLVHRRMGHAQAELDCLEKALEIFRPAQNLRGQSECLFLLADYRERSGDLTAAVELSNAALTIHTDVDDPRLRADAHHRLGVAYARRGDAGEATRQLNLAANIYRARSDRTGQLRTLTQLGLLARDRDQPETAIELFQQAVTLTSTDGIDPTHALPALVNLSELCCDDNQHDIGYTYAREAVGLCRPQRDYHHMVRALIALVRALNASGRRDEAIREARKVAELVADVPDQASNTALREMRQLGLIT